MSALSYRLQLGSYGSVRVERRNRKLAVHLTGEPVLILDLLTGVAKLDPIAVTIQHKNLFNTFFSIVKCHRYHVEISSSKLWLIDSIKKSRREIPTTGTNVMLPPKSLLAAWMDSRTSINHYGLESWFNDLESDRQSAADAT
jgi:hypothetical protein